MLSLQVVSVSAEEQLLLKTDDDVSTVSVDEEEGGEDGVEEVDDGDVEFGRRFTVFVQELVESQCDCRPLGRLPFVGNDLTATDEGRKIFFFGIIW